MNIKKVQLWRKNTIPHGCPIGISSSTCWSVVQKPLHHRWNQTKIIKKTPEWNVLFVRPCEKTKMPAAHVKVSEKPYGVPSFLRESTTRHHAMVFNSTNTACSSVTFVPNRPNNKGERKRNACLRNKRACVRKQPLGCDASRAFWWGFAV